MASAAGETQTKTGPALATTWEGAERALLDTVAPLVDFLEIAPDGMAAWDGRGARLRREALDEIASLGSMRLVVHGVGLSIGTCDGWNESYLELLDQFFERFAPRWHSEHLGYTTVAGENMGTMLPPERTEAMLDLLCERIFRIQRRYGVPFLLEHIVNILPEAPARYSAAGFLNELTKRTGCGLLIDARNLECDHLNFRFDIEAFLTELDLSAVRELHVAGGTRYNGFELDVHSRPVARSTVDIARDILRRARNIEVVTFEFLKEAIPVLGREGIRDELRRLRRAILQ